MTTANPQTLLTQIRERQQQIVALQQLNDDDKTLLEALFNIGAITDKLSIDNISATRATRTTWTYSPAVKQLQELEQLEAIATPKTSVSWVVRESKA